MGKVTVGRRLSQECARCDDGAATVARIDEVTVGRQMKVGSRLPAQDWEKRRRSICWAACSEGEVRMQLFWWILGIFLCLESSFYVLRAITLARRRGR